MLDGLFLLPFQILGLLTFRFKHIFHLLSRHVLGLFGVCEQEVGVVGDVGVFVCAFVILFFCKMLGEVACGASHQAVVAQVLGDVETLHIVVICRVRHFFVFVIFADCDVGVGHFVLHRETFADFECNHHVVYCRFVVAIELVCDAESVVTVAEVFERIARRVLGGKVSHGFLKTLDTLLVELDCGVALFGGAFDVGCNDEGCVVEVSVQFGLRISLEVEDRHRPRDIAVRLCVIGLVEVDDCGVEIDLAHQELVVAVVFYDGNSFEDVAHTHHLIVY